VADLCQTKEASQERTPCVSLQPRCERRHIRGTQNQIRAASAPETGEELPDNCCFIYRAIQKRVSARRGSKMRDKRAG